MNGLKATDLQDLFSSDHILSTEEITEVIRKRFNVSEYIFTTRNYTTDNVEHFTGDDIDISVDAKMAIAYVSFLQSCVTNMDFCDLPKEIVKDLNLATNKGVLCFYLTSVLNMLLRDIHNLNPKMVQGFFNYDSTFFGFTQPIRNTGFHAFTYLDGGVIDVCFYPQNIDYETTDLAIVGKVPDNIDLYGWQEPVMTEEMYIGKFSRKNHKGSTTHFKYSHIVGYQDFLLMSLSQIEKAPN